MRKAIAVIMTCVDCTQYIVFCVCGQHKAWFAGRPGRHEARRGGKTPADGQTESKEAQTEIVQNISSQGSHTAGKSWKVLVVFLIFQVLEIPGE